jgi:hypothetical protein
LKLGLQDMDWEFGWQVQWLEGMILQDTL